MTIASIPLGTTQFAQQQPVGDPTALLGDISSREWQTYLQHFVPYENQLIQYAMDPNLPAQNMKSAIQTQQTNNAQAAGIESRRLAQFDTKLTPEQRKAADLTRGIAGATSVVQAANQAKDQTVATQMGILGASNTGITGSV
jgi:hypothetical protein